MYEIYGIPPTQKVEMHITGRPDLESATAFAKNLEAFGYTQIRITVPTPPPVPLPDIHVP